MTDDPREKDRKAHDTAQMLKMVASFAIPAALYLLTPSWVIAALGPEGAAGILIMTNIGLIVLFGEVLHSPFIRIADWWHGNRDRT